MWALLLLGNEECWVSYLGVCTSGVTVGNTGKASDEVWDMMGIICYNVGGICLTSSCNGKPFFTVWTLAHSSWTHSTTCCAVFRSTFLSEERLCKSLLNHFTFIKSLNWSEVACMDMYFFYASVDIWPRTKGQPKGLCITETSFKTWRQDLNKTWILVGNKWHAPPRSMF